MRLRLVPQRDVLSDIGRQKRKGPPKRAFLQASFRSHGSGGRGDKRFHFRSAALSPHLLPSLAYCQEWSHWPEPD